MADDSKIAQEHSAGVIVFRITSNGARHYLLLDHGRHWDFPKGHVEPGETDRSAAERELFEETGIRGAAWIESFCRRIEYVFRSRRAVVRKSVVFFLASTSAGEIRLSREHRAAEWLTYGDALTRITFANSRELLRQAEHLLGGPQTLE